MFRRIATCRYKYPPGIRVGRKLRNLVASLLTVDAAKRLGAYGAQEVMNHPWLETIDWMKVARREYRVSLRICSCVDIPTHGSTFPFSSARPHHIFRRKTTKTSR